MKHSRTPATLCVFGQAGDAGRSTIFTLDPVTGTTREFTKITDIQNPDWALAPNGSVLALFAPDPHTGRIHLLSMRDTSARDLIVKGLSGLMSMDWSGDSRTLFTSAMRPDGTLFLLNVDLAGNATARPPGVPAPLAAAFRLAATDRSSPVPPPDLRGFVLETGP